MYIMGAVWCNFMQLSYHKTALRTTQFGVGQCSYFILRVGLNSLMNASCIQSHAKFCLCLFFCLT